MLDLSDDQRPANPLFEGSLSTWAEIAQKTEKARATILI
jgi:hypothetical protein